MKKYLAYFIGCMLLMSEASHGQSEKWTISLDYGLQAHDKRLFDFPPFTTASILERQPEHFGTHQFAAKVVRELKAKGRLHFFAGGGLGVEMATFSRPFNYFYGKGYGDRVLRYTDRYFQYLVLMPLVAKYKVTGPLMLSMEILPQTNFLTMARDTHSKGKPPENFNRWSLGFYSVEFNPGIEFTTSRLIFGLRYRVYQIKKFDRVLFNEVIKTTQPTTFETENPFKLWFSVGYRL